MKRIKENGGGGVEKFKPFLCQKKQENIIQMAAVWSSGSMRSYG